MNIIKSRLSDISYLKHGFFTREGGISTNNYGTLNASYASKDDKKSVHENRLRIAVQLGVTTDDLITLSQTHSDNVITITEKNVSDHTKTSPAGIEADALVTNLNTIALGILTADCAPILLACHDKPIIGAIHAGWKGALGGIIQNTVKAMEDLGATRNSILAVIGPCIGRLSYEVTTDFAQPFLEQSGNNENFFMTSFKGGRLHFDLPGYVAERLTDCGIRDIQITGHDTYQEDNLFFSYRRATLRKEGDIGRQISAISIS